MGPLVLADWLWFRLNQVVPGICSVSSSYAAAGTTTEVYIWIG